MPKATFNGVVLAESNKGKVVEGNYYFPSDSINREYFTDSKNHTTCPWKGQASYYNIEVDGQVLQDAAWYYPAPKTAAKEIENSVAFSKRSVQIEN